MDYYLASIILFAGNFAPAGWAFCNGQLLSISQNTALFSLLGTTYGGDGKTTFALPDLRGRAPIHFGQGAGLSNVDIGQAGGSQTATLADTNLPAHTHALRANDAHGGDPTPNAKRVLGTGAVYTNDAPTVDLDAASITSTGGGAAFSIEQPYLAINFIIALQGVFPSRS